MQRASRRQFGFLALACFATLTACSGSDDAAAPSTAPPTSTAPSTTAAPTTEPSTTAPPTTVPDTTAPPTTAPFTAPLAGTNGFPLTAGTWSIDGTLRYELTVTADWGIFVNTPDPQQFSAGRDFGATFFYISVDDSGTTPEQAVANPCSNGGATTMQPSTPTTLFGQPALEAVGVVTEDCPLAPGLSATASDDPLMVIAAEVDGHLVTVMGGYPVGSDGAFVDEFHAIAASLTLVG